jgi:hypothetical protein
MWGDLEALDRQPGRVRVSAGSVVQAKPVIPASSKQGAQIRKAS